MAYDTRSAYDMRLQRHNYSILQLANGNRRSGIWNHYSIDNYRSAIKTVPPPLFYFISVRIFFRLIFMHACIIRRCWACRFDIGSEMRLWVWREIEAISFNLIEIQWNKNKNQFGINSRDLCASRLLWSSVMNGSHAHIIVILFRENYDCISTTTEKL